MALDVTGKGNILGCTTNFGYCVIDAELAEQLRKDAALITPELDEDPEQETSCFIGEEPQKEWHPEDDLYWQLFGVRKYSRAWEQDMAVCEAHDRLYDECIAKGIDPATRGL